MKDFEAIESLVESSKVADDTIAIRLCADSIIDFDGEIDMTGAKFAMTCAGDSCRLDGQGTTRLFRAGNLDGPFDSDHDVSFDTIQFFNASGVRLWLWYALACIQNHTNNVYSFVFNHRVKVAQFNSMEE